ncbi:hypothetical protein SBRY_30594 [Actinacidiphila bryophytorum]|uniref:Uncharacterized protein n=1 Tax=Actinacidiphila bryophytorum TaxID=1436133 RepID=A0A9W4H1G0_9ACTN|nr:hypothetical protein SBRY_30594 [Actinacidiphila bryophytorum]
MTHPVAVGAEERKIAERGLAYTGYMERQHVMHLDVAFADGAVEVCEAEAAHCAGQRRAGPPCLRDLRESQGWAPLPGHEDTGQEASLERRAAKVVSLLRLRLSRLKFAGGIGLAESACHCQHLGGPLSELGDHDVVELPAPSRHPRETGAVGCKIRRLPAHAAGGPELRY